MKKWLFCILFALIPAAFAQADPETDDPSNSLADPTHSVTVNVERIFELDGEDTSFTHTYDSALWDGGNGEWITNVPLMGPLGNGSISLNHNYGGDVELQADTTFVSGPNNDFTIEVEVTSGGAGAHNLVTSGTPEPTVTVQSLPAGQTDVALQYTAVPGSLGGTPPGTYVYEVAYTLLPPLN